MLGIKLQRVGFFGKKKTGDKARGQKSTNVTREVHSEHVHPRLKCQRPHVHLHRAQVSSAGVKRRLLIETNPGRYAFT